MVWEPAIFFWVCEKPLSPLGFQNLKLLAKQLSREKKVLMKQNILEKRFLFVVLQPRLMSNFYEEDFCVQELFV